MKPFPFQHKHCLKKIVYANFSAFKLAVAFYCTFEAIYHVFQDEC